MLVRAHLLVPIAAAFFPIAAYAQTDIEFAWPVACQLGETCAIQHYVDRDPGPGARDFTCGTVTYDGHKGTDIRLPTMAARQAGVDVLAAAAGRVLRRRDDMPDISVRDAGERSVAGRECGNGVVIEHGNGWETQYCHMAQASLRVKAGEIVSAGQPLGKVGLSGDTEFPHLHFTVRHKGEIVDPFAFGSDPASCSGGRSLWASPVRSVFAYHAGEVLNSGFAAAPVTMADIEAGLDRQKPARDAPALVAFVRAIGLRKGDEQRLRVRDPDGKDIAKAAMPPLDNNKAQYMMFTGAKRRSPEWPPGEYVADYEVTRDGRVVVHKTFRLTL
jgi:murein DD-endopeptidase MepM/ murein hydrolase activator NlpD